MIKICSLEFAESLATKPQFNFEINFLCSLFDIFQDKDKLATILNDGVLEKTLSGSH